MTLSIRRFLAYAIAAVAIAYALGPAGVDPDLWGHLTFGGEMWRSGEIPRKDIYSYTAYEKDWIDHEWLSEMIMFGAFRWDGAAGLTALRLLAALLLLVVLVKASLRASRGLFSLAVMVWLAAPLIAQGFAIRPQIFSYLLAGATLFLFAEAEKGNRRALLPLPPLMALWVNLHGGFVMGLLMIGFLCLWVSLRSARCCRPELGSGVPAAVAGLGTPGPRPGLQTTILFVWLIFVAAVAATLINPYGWRLWGFLTRTLFAHYRIGEWSPLSPSANIHFYRFALLTAAVAVAGWFSPVRRSFLYWLFLFLAAAAFLQMRHSPFAALAAVAVGPAALEGMAATIRRRTGFSISAPLLRVIAAAMGGLVLFQGGFAAVELVRARGRIPVNLDHYPVRAVAFMREKKMTGNLLAMFEWGEYCIFHLAPACRVSFDGRFETVYPPAVIRDNFAFDLRGEDGFSPRILTVYPTTLALVEKAMLGYRYLEKHPGWRAVFEDDRSALFVADIPSNRRWLEPAIRVPAVSGNEAYYFP